MSLIGIFGGGASRPAPQQQPKPQQEAPQQKPEPKPQQSAPEASSPSSAPAGGPAAASQAAPASRPTGAPDAAPAAPASRPSSAVTSDDGRRGEAARVLASSATAEQAEAGPSEADLDAQARRLAEQAVDAARKAAILDLTTAPAGPNAAALLEAGEPRQASPYAGGDAAPGRAAEGPGAGLDRRV